MANGAGAGFGAQHSQATENWFLNVPGLKIAVPATVPDLYGLLRTAVLDDDPVLFFEHKNLFAVKGEFPGQDYRVPLGKADVVRTGDDVTIVATQQMRHRAERAAEQLATEGIEAEVLDPRTLIPFDDDAVAASLRRTSRLAVVQEAPQAGSWGASLVARMTGDHFELLDAPPLLIAADDTPIPYAAALEEAWLPSVDRIVAEVRKQSSY
jgi:pyruvate dehydrogenase E1 component beta subunit